jgi:hypothetical protein
VTYETIFMGIFSILPYNFRAPDAQSRLVEPVHSRGVWRRESEFWRVERAGFGGSESGASKSELAAAMTGGGDAVLQVVSNAASITQLASNVTSSLSAIKKALKDMEDLPKELKDLRHIVDEGHTKVLNLPRILQPEDWDRFLPCLERLSVALKSARDLDVQLAGDQNFGEDFIKGLLGSGASEQIPEAKRLKKSVECDLRIIDGAILELQAQRLKSLESTLSGTSRSTQAPNFEVGVKLESLSRQKIGEEIIEDVLAAPSHRADYQSLTGKEDPVDEDEEDGERGSVKGGTYEVDNNSKIRLIMKSEEPRFFYVVAFDSSNQEPKLFYPDISLARNELQLINRSANRYSLKHL